MRTEYLELTDEQRTKVQQLELTILLEVDRLCKRHGLHYGLCYGTLLGAIRHNGFIPWDDDIDIWLPRKDFDAFRAICAKELDAQFFYQTQATDPEYFYLYDKIRMNGTVFRELAQGKRAIHHGVYIDVFPVDNVPDDEAKRKRQVFLFQLFRYGLQAKSVDLAFRSGWKLWNVLMLRLLYAAIPKRVLYKAAQKVLRKYDGGATKRMANLCGFYRVRDVFPREVFHETVNHEFEGHAVSIPKAHDMVLRQLYDDYMQLPPPEKQVTRHPILELSL